MDQLCVFWCRCYRLDLQIDYIVQTLNLGNWSEIAGYDSTVLVVWMKACGLNILPMTHNMYFHTPGYYICVNHLIAVHLYSYPFSPIGSYSLVTSLKLLYGLGRGEGRESCIRRNMTIPSHTASWHTARLSLKPAAPMCRRKHCITGNRVIMQAAGPPRKSLERDGTRTSRPAKPFPNPDDAGANCASPHGSPSRGRLRHSLGSTPDL